jgi:hypothetical protein
MMKKLLLHLAAACCLVSLAHAQETTIGVYLDEAGTVCNGTSTAGVTTGSVWVNLGGAAAAGISGAEFRVDNSMRDFTTVSVSVDPGATIVLGDPFNPDPNGAANLTGTNIVYANCQTGPRVQLMTFTLIENTPTNDIVLTVMKHKDPSNYTFDCPLVTLCDAPAFTKVCVGAPEESVHWRATLNALNEQAADCVPVGVSQTTWSQVKAMYN